MAQKAPSWLKGLIKKKPKSPADDSPALGASGNASCEGEGEIESGGKHGIGLGMGMGMCMGMQAEGRSFQQNRGEEGADGCDYMCDSLLPAHPEPRLQKAAEEDLMSKPVSKKRALEQGLSQPIGDDNLGFKMLSKMGYKGGCGIGPGTGGIATPLDVVLKSGRAGVGVDEEKIREKRQALEMSSERRQVAEQGAEEMRRGFAARQKAAFAAKQAARDLQKAQRVCEQLDRRVGMEENQLWGRPEGPDGDLPKGELRGFVAPNGDVYYTQVLSRSDAEKQNQPEEEVMTSEQVVETFMAVVRYLRERHVYCFGCGGKFPSEGILEEHCEGDEDCMALFKGSVPAQNADEIDISGF